MNFIDFVSKDVVNHGTSLELLAEQKTQLQKAIPSEYPPKSTQRVHPENLHPEDQIPSGEMDAFLIVQHLSL